MIDIIQNNHKQAVSAKELYAKLGLDISNWSKWHKKNITQNPFAIEGEDYTALVLSTNGNPNPTQDFALSIDFAKKLAMMTRTEKGDKIRRYFILCEKKLKENQSQNTKPITAAEQLLHSAQILVEQERRLKLMESKIEEINTRTQTRPDYFTIVGYATLNKISVNLKLASSLGRKCTALCKEKNLLTDECPDPRFGIVKMYPLQILQEVFSQPLT